LPWTVLDCPAYQRLSHPARSLLIEFARQVGSDNNGRLLASSAYLSKRGWKSDDVINRAKRQLLDEGFIYETVKGRRPNRASWYAVTWRTLDRLPGYDAGAEAGFERGAYRKDSTEKITGLNPSDGAKPVAIAPSHGVRSILPTPSDGAIRGKNLTLSTPSPGHHLDKPSTYAV